MSRLVFIFCIIGGILILIGALTGCGELKREFAPDVIVIENSLNNDLRDLLEISLRDEACHLIRAEGFNCDIPEQIHSIKFTWYHDQHNSVGYKLEFCLKANCPPGAPEE